jgi:hypothetical protein
MYKADQNIVTTSTAVTRPRSSRSKSHSIREIIVASHVTEKIFRYVLFSLSKMAIGKGRGKGLDFKKRIGTAKSSSVYESNNKFETCPMTICR